MRFISLPASLGAILLLAGCGAAGTLNTATGPAPAVLGTGLQTNGVAINRQIDVQFSTAMNPATITTQTFLLATGNGGASVPGTVTYDATNFVASFKPSAALDTNTSYNATITTGVTNTAGVPLAANYAFSFVTRNSVDNSGIKVYETIPTNGQTGVAVNAPIQVVFTEGAASNTVNNTTFVVTDVSGTRISGTVTYDIVTNYATFTPSSPLLPGASYDIFLNGVTDLAGQPMALFYGFSFTTAGTSTQIQDLIYEADVSPGAISGWVFDLATGGLTQASGSPYPAGLEPVQMIPSPDRQTLYVIMGNQPPGIHGANCFDFNTQVFSYAVDHSTGALIEENRLALRGYCASASSVIDPTGQFLYVGESTSQTTGGSGLIDILSLTSGGQMSFASNSPFELAQVPTAFALDGNYMYAAIGNNSGTDGLLTYQRNPVTGALLYLSGTTMPPQDSVAVSASGNNLYSIGTGTGLISEFQVTAGTLALQGTVTAAASSTFPFEIATDPQGRYVGVSSHYGTLLYSVDSSGAIITTGPDAQPIDNYPGSITFDTTGSATTILAGNELMIYSLPGPDLSQLATTAGTAHPGAIAMFTK